MSAGLRVGVVLLFAGLLVGRDAVAVDAMVPMDSGAVSGIGIRNIGSATMSGRIAAVAAAAPRTATRPTPQIQESPMS